MNLVKLVSTAGTFRWWKVGLVFLASIVFYIPFFTLFPQGLFYSFIFNCLILNALFMAPTPQFAFILTWFIWVCIFNNGLFCDKEDGKLDIAQQAPFPDN